MQIADPQTPKLARPFSPADREDSIPKRQIPAEVNTLPAIAGAYNRNEIATLTDDQNALHTAKVNEIDINKFGVVQVVDRPQSRQALSKRWSIHSTQKINDMSYNQLLSDLSTYVKKRTHRSEDSILLRRMDDVVGTGPDEQLMNGFEHMKTSLYLTDVVVLRHEGDTVNF